MLTENMCPSRSICQRAPEGMDVCLFTSLGDISVQFLWGPCSRTHCCALSEQLLAGLAAAEVSGVPSSSGKGALPPAGLLAAGTTCQGSALGTMHLGRVSSARTAPAALLGYVSGVNQTPQLLHCKACVVHLYGRQSSPS